MTSGWVCLSATTLPLCDGKGIIQSVKTCVTYPWDFFSGTSGGRKPKKTINARSRGKWQLDGGGPTKRHPGGVQTASDGSGWLRMAFSRTGWTKVLVRLCVAACVRLTVRWKDASCLSCWLWWTDWNSEPTWSSWRQLIARTASTRHWGDLVGVHY